MVRMNDLDEPYWLEDPTTVLSPIKAFLKKGGSYDLDQKRSELALERKSDRKFVAKSASEKRRHFTALIDLAGKAGSYSEEHDLYCELHCHAVMRRGFFGIGRRLAAAGTMKCSRRCSFPESRRSGKSSGRPGVSQNAAYRGQEARAMGRDQVEGRSPRVYDPFEVCRRQ